MAPVRTVGPVSRLLGYLVFLAWCVAVGAAIAAVGLFRVGWLAGRLGRREPAPLLP